MDLLKDFIQVSQMLFHGRREHGNIINVNYNFGWLQFIKDLIHDTLENCPRSFHSQWQYFPLVETFWGTKGGYCSGFLINKQLVISLSEVQSGEVS